MEYIGDALTHLNDEHNHLFLGQLPISHENYRIVLYVSETIASIYISLKYFFDKKTKLGKLPFIFLVIAYTNMFSTSL